MLGSKSVVIFENEINPNILTNIADTIIVSGFFTLNFDNILVLFLAYTFSPILLLPPEICMAAHM